MAATRRMAGRKDEALPQLSFPKNLATGTRQLRNSREPKGSRIQNTKVKRPRSASVSGVTVTKTKRRRNAERIAPQPNFSGGTDATEILGMGFQRELKSSSEPKTSSSAVHADTCSASESRAPSMANDLSPSNSKSAPDSEVAHLNAAVHSTDHDNTGNKDHADTPSSKKDDVSDSTAVGNDSSKENNQSNGEYKRKRGRPRSRSGVGLRVLQNRLDKRIHDPKLKDSEKLKAIAASLDLDNEMVPEPYIPSCFAEAAGNPNAFSLLSPVAKLSKKPVRKMHRRTSSAPVPAAISARKSNRTIPSKEKDTDNATALFTTSAAAKKGLRNLPLTESFTAGEQIVPQRRSARNTKSLESGSKSAAATQKVTGEKRRKNKSDTTPKSIETSQNLEVLSKELDTPKQRLSRVTEPLAPQLPSLDDDFSGPLPNLHADDMPSTSGAENPQSFTGLTPRIRFQSTHKKVRHYCDTCEFYADSIGIMVFHQRSHSVTLMQKRGLGKRQGSETTSQVSGRRKASFDPNVDLDALDEPFVSASLPSDPACLTPSDSDDEDLPDISSSSCEDFPIVKGDLVWVRCHGAPFWPAVVMKVYTRKGRPWKFTVVFIGKFGVRNTDSKDARPWFTKYTFLSKKNTVIQWGPRTQEFKKQAYSSEFSEAFHNSISRAEGYIFGRATGEEYDYEDYFAEDIGNAEERYLKKLEAAGELSEETLRRVIPQLVPQEPSDDEKQEEEDENSEEEADSTLEEENNEPLTEADLKREEFRRNRSARLVEVMTSKACLEHLDKIYKEKEYCARHTQFRAAKTFRERFAIAMSHGFGPIHEDHWDGMLLKMTKHVNRKYDDRTFAVDKYFLDVWLPEAVVFAIRKVDKISVPKAEKVFNAGIRQTKKEKEKEAQETHDSLLRNIDPEEVERYRQKLLRQGRENGLF